MNHLLAENIIS